MGGHAERDGFVIRGASGEQPVDDDPFRVAVLVAALVGACAIAHISTITNENGPES
jgi:hypothetical protein